jgi:Skp family chaperone for outer membrane proteins
MKFNVMLALAMLAVACKVEKTGQDTYKVVAPTPKAKAAAEKLKEETSTAAAKLSDELKKVGDKAKEKTESKTEATSTVETETSTKTETRAKTRRH